MTGRALSWARATVVGLALLVTAGCSTSSATRTSSGTSASSVTSAAQAVPAPGAVPPTTGVSGATASSTTLAGQLPTVFDCGGGAYEPTTLLVVCGTAATTATQVRWTSWTATAASGSGMVHLTGHPTPAPASLALSKVVSTRGGPQFSVLEVTWSGGSPDGKPSDVYRLGVSS